jgi:hypothetical protein
MDVLKELKVMDATAISLLYAGEYSIVVFNSLTMGT